MRVVNSEYDSNSNPISCVIEDDGEYFHFVREEPRETGEWTYYSTTMMECSVCKKHVPRHRYTYCPHCASKNVWKVY